MGRSLRYTGVIPWYTGVGPAKTAPGTWCLGNGGIRVRVRFYGSLQSSTRNPSISWREASGDVFADSIALLGYSLPTLGMYAGAETLLRLFSDDRVRMADLAVKPPVATPAWSGRRQPTGIGFQQYMLRFLWQIDQHKVTSGIEIVFTALIHNAQVPVALGLGIWEHTVGLVQL